MGGEERWWFQVVPTRPTWEAGREDTLLVWCCLACSPACLLDSYSPGGHLNRGGMGSIFGERCSGLQMKQGDPQFKLCLVLRSRSVLVSCLLAWRPQASLGCCHLPHSLPRYLVGRYLCTYLLMYLSTYIRTYIATYGGTY
jgi:hypothetical protein